MEPSSPSQGRDGLVLLSEMIAQGPCASIAESRATEDCTETPSSANDHEGIVQQLPQRFSRRGPNLVLLISYSHFLMLSSLSSRGAPHPLSCADMVIALDLSGNALIDRGVATIIEGAKRSRSLRQLSLAGH